MLRRLSLTRPTESSHDGFVRDRQNNKVMLGFLFVAILLICHVLISKLGIAAFTLFLVLLFFGLLYAFVSFRFLVVPFTVAILSVGGFRFLWSVSMPGLPDLYIDRVAMIWLVAVFSVKTVAERKTLRAPFLLDILLVVNALYLAVSFLLNDSTYFSLWTRSYLVPYAAYFMAKNIVVTQRYMRFLLILLATLGMYYAVTSIAEKFSITQLIWPKSILYIQTMWWGRSNGPFSHAPLFGTVQGMILPVYLYLIATARNKLIRVFSYLMLAMGLTGLYFTYTRGSWLAGIVALLVTIALNRRHYLKISAPAIALLPLIAVFVLGAGNDKMMKDRVDDDQTITARLGTAVTAIRMWQDHPIFGVGFFRYRNVRDQYIDPVEVPVYGTIRFANFRHTSIHDIYLGPLAETGLVGTFLQLAIYILIIRAIVRHVRRRDVPPHFRLFLLPVFTGLSVGYLVGGISIDYRFFSMVGTMFYSAAGIVYGYNGRVAVSSESNIVTDERWLDDEA